MTPDFVQIVWRAHSIVLEYIHTIHVMCDARHGVIKKCVEVLPMTANNTWDGWFDARPSRMMMMLPVRGIDV
jgi:hypothetical protein